MTNYEVYKHMHRIKRQYKERAPGRQTLPSNLAVVQREVSQTTLRGSLDARDVELTKLMVTGPKLSGAGAQPLQPAALDI